MWLCNELYMYILTCIVSTITGNDQIRPLSLPDHTGYPGMFYIYRQKILLLERSGWVIERRAKQRWKNFDDEIGIIKKSYVYNYCHLIN